MTPGSGSRSYRPWMFSTTAELLGILRGLAGINLVGADIVEVAPPYDTGEITAVAASHAAYELLALFAGKAG
jgi:agmatinase